MILEILSFLGLLFGAILYNFTKEEFKPGKKYFILLNRIILFILVVSLVYFSNLAWWGIVILFIIGLIVGYYVKNIYLFFGLVVSVFQTDLFRILVFLFGLPYGTLNGKKPKKFLIKNLVFFVAGLLGFFLIDYSSYMGSLLAGILFFKLISKEII